MAAVDNGLKLPDEPSAMSCLPFLKNLVWCYGPEGVLSGLYREGHGTSCVPFMDRFVTCAQVKITPSHEKQISLLNDAKERLKKEEKLPERPPVWTFRKEPPADFHYYQTVTEQEWDDEFDNFWSLIAAKGANKATL